MYPAIFNHVNQANCVIIYNVFKYDEIFLCWNCGLQKDNFEKKNKLCTWYSLQVRGPRKHLKRLNAPKHWMLDKLGGVFAPRPSTGPHKLRECLPLVVFLRNRLKYALTYDEVKKIVNQRLIKVSWWYFNVSVNCILWDSTNLKW